MTNQSEVKTCQNCKSAFTIEPEDFNFYEKIQVPPPTFCPKCRMQRRLAFFNPLSLFRRRCDLCKKESISMYHPEAPYRVYCPRCWWSDNWDFSEYGRDYDFSRPFFEQFNELWHEAPLLGLSIDSETLPTSPHTNHVGHTKNSYLVFHTDYDEDSAYGFYHVRNKDVLDCSMIMLSELCYDSMNVWKVSRGVGLRSQTTESLDVAFLKDCGNCQNCFASTNLRNKKYYIFNQPYTKGQYFEELKKWDLGSYKTYREVKNLAETHWRKFPPKPRFDEMSTGCTGDAVFESKNCKECYEVVDAEDSKFLFMMAGGKTRDSYDVSNWGNNASLLYECCNAGENVARIKFSNESGLTLHDAEYCKLSTAASHHFGCVSVKKGSYVILNKRYSPEEFAALREKIIVHMSEMPYTDARGRVYRYGEFFPVELSPFAYNETLTQKFFPLTKEEVEQKGYRWRESETRQYAVTMSVDKLPDHIHDASDSILDEVIACAKCRRGFKIIRMELDFLRKMNLSLPRECPFCRINEKVNVWVKNLTLTTRTCSKCGAEFQTRYTKEEAEYILCKECWTREVV